jgi:hypothetical protein
MDLIVNLKSKWRSKTVEKEKPAWGLIQAGIFRRWL